MARLFLSVCLLSVAGCEKTQAAPDLPPTERYACGIPDQEPISGRVEVPSKCDAVVRRPVRIRKGGELVIHEGASIRFERGAGLFVEGGALVAKGTRESPILLTSEQAVPKPGDWRGVSVGMPYREPTDGAAVWNGPPPAVVSTLEYVVVEFAGNDRDVGALHVHPWYDVVDIAHLTIRSSSGLGLDVLWETSVRRFEDVAIEAALGDAVSLPTSLVPAVKLDSDASVRIHEVVTKSTYLARRQKPYIVDALQPRFGVEASERPVVLEIAPGTTVLLPERALITLSGEPSEARMIAHDVRFASAAPDPKPGDWGGFFLSGSAATDLERVIIEHVGAVERSCPQYGVFRLPTEASHIKITSSVFRNNRLPAFANGQCATWESPLLKNVSLGQPLCARWKAGHPF